MIHQGDCLEVMKQYHDNHFTNILTDPPYGLSFMGKAWDHSVPGKEFWIEALRICKPGAIMLAFGGTRTYHRLACAIEDAGWEIRDCLMWIYGSGFPKSHNHFGFEGYGTALKPAYEPILLCMKPLDGTFAQNAEKWGVAGINIDGSRIEGLPRNTHSDGNHRGPQANCYGKYEQIITPKASQGRWPANTLFDEQAAEMLDEQSGVLKSGSGDKHGKTQNGGYQGGFKPLSGVREYQADSGGASRFFYCAKASSAERNGGCEGLPQIQCQTGCGGAMPIDDDGKHRDRFKKMSSNHHPTVKPLKLLEYLLKLITPPKNALVLDPFAGSGSTLVAAKNLGIACEGIEINAEYCEIAKSRVAI